MRRRKGSLSLVAAAGLAILSLAGCDTDTVYHSYRHVAPSGWEREDTLRFHLDTLRENMRGQLSVGLRCDDRYPYKSIWVVVEGRFAPPLLTWRDTVECRLADSLNRMQRGIHVYQYDTPAGSQPFTKGQTGTIRVWHCMQREHLPGILDIGIRLRHPR